MKEWITADGKYILKEDGKVELVNKPKEMKYISVSEKKEVFFVDDIEDLINESSCVWEDSCSYIEKKDFDEFKTKIIDMLNNAEFMPIDVISVKEE